MVKDNYTLLSTLHFMEYCLICMGVIGYDSYSNFNDSK